MAGDDDIGACPIELRGDDVVVGGEDKTADERLCAMHHTKAQAALRKAQNLR